MMIGDRCFKNSNEIDVRNRFYFTTGGNINEKNATWSTHFWS